MCRFADRTGRLILLFSPGDQVRRGGGGGWSAKSLSCVVVCLIPISKARSSSVCTFFPI